MEDYRHLSDKELDILIQEDDKYVLYEKARRLKSGGDLKEARKFFVFSSVLGCPESQVELGRIYEDEGDSDAAYELYCLAYNQGDDEILTSIVRLLLETDKEFAMSVLLANAHDGHIGCVEMLIDIFDAADNKKETDFWTKKLVEIKHDEIKRQKRIAEAAANTEYSDYPETVFLDKKSDDTENG